MRPITFNRICLFSKTHDMSVNVYTLTRTWCLSTSAFSAGTKCQMPEKFRPMDRLDARASASFKWNTMACIKRRWPSVAVESLNGQLRQSDQGTGDTPLVPFRQHLDSADKRTIHVICGSRNEKTANFLLQLVCSSLTAIDRDVQLTTSP